MADARRIRFDSSAGPEAGRRILMAGTVLAGAALAAAAAPSQAQVGEFTIHHGTVTVEDRRNHGEYYVGRLTGDDGALIVRSGGEVLVERGYIGHDAGAVGSVTVTGAGSRLYHAYNLYVGLYGDGTLTIADGAQVSNEDGAYIGFHAGSTGSATVTGAGSRWVGNPRMPVGLSGDGSLLISDGGRLESDGGILGSRVGATGSATVTGAGSLWDNFDDSLFVGSNGDGVLMIADGGEVRSMGGFIGAGSGTGHATVTGAGSLWALVDDLEVGGGGSGSLTLAEGGTVRVGPQFRGEWWGAMSIASGVGAVGTLNIGAAPGDAAAGPGVLQTGHVRFGAGTGTLVFNHTAADYEFTPAVTGSGSILHLSGVTRLTGDSSGFAGTTTIEGGRLEVLGRLGGRIVMSGGALAGSGALGSLTAGGGAVIAPGESIGVLTVTGDLVFGAGSTYEVEADPASGASDRIVVGGTATLNGGIVRHVGLDGPYQASSTYTILTAEGGVTGAFDAIETDFAFLDASLSYQTNAVLMTLERNMTPFFAVGLTPNQRSTGEAVEALGVGEAAHDAVVVLDVDDARLAFDRLSGALHGSLRMVMSEDATRLRESVAARLEEGRPLGDGLAFWARGSGARTRLSGDGGIEALAHRAAGLALGADAGFGTARVGAMVRRAAHDYRGDGRRDEADGTSLSLAVYGSAQSGPLDLRGGVSRTWHEVDSVRQAVFPGFAETLRARYETETTQAFAEVAWAVDAGRATLEPYAGIARVRTGTDGFAETGGDAALTVRARDQAYTTAEIGLGARHGFGRGPGGGATLTGRVGWRHAWGDTDGAGRHAFAASPAAFTVRGLPVPEDVLVARLALDMSLRERLAFSVDWNGQYGSGLKADALNATLSWRF